MCKEDVNILAIGELFFSGDKTMTSPLDIIANELKDIEKEIRRINKAIAFLKDTEYRTAVIAMAKGEPYLGEADFRRTLIDLYDERRELRRLQKQLVELRTDPGLEVFAENFQTRLQDLSDAYKDDEKAHKWTIEKTEQ